MVLIVLLNVSATSAACSGASSRLPETPVPVSQTSSPALRKAGVDARCKPFESIFDELVACQRANGTILTFNERPIGWRVRYYVKYWEMPCSEEPTVEEAYVFHMVTNDLYNDSDLDGGQRLDIRNAMFDGKVHCK